MKCFAGLSCFMSVLTVGCAGIEVKRQRPNTYLAPSSVCSIISHMFPLSRLILRAQLLADVVVFASAAPGQRNPEAGAAWPAITRQTRPWAYWWWHGSAVDKTNLSHE